MISFNYSQLVLVLLFFVSIEATAQQDGWKVYSDAEKFMQEDNYDVALKAFEYITDLPDVSYKITICSLLSNRIKNLPVERYLAFQETNGKDPLYHYWLGKIYLKRMNIEKARENFTSFLSSSRVQSAGEVYKSEAVEIMACLAMPSAYQVTPMESPLNSAFAESSGFFYDGQKKFIFASDRASEGFFGVYCADKGQYGWDSPQLLSRVPATHAENLNIIPVHNSIFFFDTKAEDLFFISQTDTGWSEVSPFETRILNNARHIYINRYKNRIIFSALNGENGLDLYESVKLRTTGEWTTPLSISDELNTSFNEDFPFLSDDRTRLYFCSDRPGGVGKMDIYYSDYDDKNNRWSKAENMGMPVNSMDNDIDFKLLNEQEGVLASDRMASRGDLDIFYFKKD